MSKMFVNGSLVNTVNGTSMLASLSTEGGEVIRLTGSNFGPAYPRSYVSAIWYGPSYFMSNCTFTEAHSEIECVSVPGTGSGYRLQVSQEWHTEGEWLTKAEGLCDSVCVSVCMLVFGSCP